MANGREEMRDPCRLFSSRGNVFEVGAVAIIDLAGGGQAAPGRTRAGDEPVGRACIDRSASGRTRP